MPFQRTGGVSSACGCRACPSTASSASLRQRSGGASWSNNRPASSSPNRTTRCRSTRSTIGRARPASAIGLPLANARAICPELTVFDADEVADRKTLDDIADWCDRFTPLVALDPPHGLFLDITGCAHLFGGERALLQIVCGALTRRGFAVSAAIAEHLDLRPHADAPDFRQDHCRGRGGRGRQPAAGIRARRRMTPSPAACAAPA